MSDTMAPVTRRRIPRGLFGALVAFLFLPFPAVCLAGPLAGILVLARPSGIREWSWVAAAILIGALSFGASRALAQEIVLAYGVAFTGGFLALRTWRPGPVLPRAVVAALDTAIIIAIGAWIFGLDWVSVRAALDAQFQDALTLVIGGSPVTPDQMEQLRQTMRGMAAVYPGIAILGAIGGGALASALAWHITDGRSGPEPGSFPEFRFNDHVIWGAILTLALALLPLPSPVSTLVANAVVVWAGLYAARGLAVVLWLGGRWSLPLRFMLAIASIFLLPYALGGLLLLGLADTWLDFRRAPSPPTQGAVDD